MNELDPIIGNWYRNLESGDQFEVVALDDDAQTVEIQFFEGEVEELDMDSWESLVLEAIDPPEDWTGPFDDLVPDDLGDNGLPHRPGGNDLDEV